MLRFIDDEDATDTISYRVGSGPRRTVNVDPGNSLSFQFVPNATRTHEPAESIRSSRRSGTWPREGNLGADNRAA